MGRWFPANTWQNPFPRSSYKLLLASAILSGGKKRAHWELPYIDWYEARNFNFLNQFKPLPYNADLWLDHKFLIFILPTSRSTSSTLSLANLCHHRQNIPSFSHLQEPFQMNLKVCPGPFEVFCIKGSPGLWFTCFPTQFPRYLPHLAVFWDDLSSPF